MAVAKKTSAFVEQLKRGNAKIRADRAERIGNKVSRAQTKLISDLEDERDSKQDELDAMMDLSSDNQKTSLNVISKDFDAYAFVNQINKLKTDIKMLEIKLTVAQETSKEWFE